MPGACGLWCRGEPLQSWAAWPLPGYCLKQHTRMVSRCGGQNWRSGCGQGWSLPRAASENPSPLPAPGVCLLASLGLLGSYRHHPDLCLHLHNIFPLLMPLCPEFPCFFFFSDKDTVICLWIRAQPTGLILTRSHL